DRPAPVPPVLPAGGGMSGPRLAAERAAPKDAAAPRAPALCGVRAFGAVRATPAAVAALRQKPGPAAAGSFRPNLLKYSDDQTVVSLAALLEAIHRFNLQGEDFSGWAVVAAPRWLGRCRATVALHKAHAEGAAGTSPMIIPHLSLHAVSGTISQALTIHG